VRLQRCILSLFSRAERLFVVGLAAIQLFPSSSTLGVPPHCTLFSESPHPSMCASAASAWGSQKVIAMAWYIAMAAVSSARACSRCSVVA
jgi:hypothetical protein